MVARASSVAGRRAKSVESFRNCADDLGQIGRGSSIFAVTRGQWSMIDAILYAIESCGGPVSISLWTWTVAEYEIATLTRLRMDRRIESGLLVIDGGARLKNAGLIAEWQGTFGPRSVRYVRNHAKIARVWTDDLRFCLRGSMNLNQNPRFEQFDLTEGGADFELVAQIESELPFVANDASNGDVITASRVGDAWRPEELAIFGGGLKTWVPK